VATRYITPLDRLIAGADQALRTVTGHAVSQRAYPADGLVDSLADLAERRRAAALMRVNHSGEVAAQALYAGQALTARSAQTQTSMVDAAREETDHLAWCAQRINELDGRQSLLNPLWYAGSFAIGALAGLIDDRISLGFVAETERQVVEHLNSHLQRLPSTDARSRTIVEQMRLDEARHGHQAIAAGGSELPNTIRACMRLTARVMTGTAYWI
jgi:3-demethoxyubiquinol 3-hydroxylase